MYENAKDARIPHEVARKLEAERNMGMGLAGAAPGPDCATVGQANSFGEQLQKAAPDGRQALARMMDRLRRDERQGERAKALREGLQALYTALPLEMPEAANRALEDLVNAHGGVR